ncbi:hypothetical protein Asp14428_21250 [Actinoplanes sp. NBRC 14428]|nr:hypothetical protein Asp14428_21250 [Actinoplanes sp. NBRC 14428]
MTQPGEYTFVPWFRRGAAADITVADDLTATATGRATMPVRVRLRYVPAAGGPAQPLPPVERTVELVGPGDVRALLPDAVLRLHPPENTRDAVPGELAFAEFYDEDLPWRFTPARAAETATGAGPATRLRPWLALLVLTDDEHSVAPRPDGTAVLTVHPAAELPPVLESWAWAHAQLTGGFADPDAAGAEADTRPDSAVARLLSPRRLLADTAYTGFLVPAFETGRLAGLGLDTATTPAQQASWGAGQADRRFPVYRSWRFRTGAGGGFEALCRGLTGRPAGPGFGKRPVVLDLDGHGLPDPAVAGTPLLEGALRPPDFSRTPYPDFPGTALVAGLESLVDLGADLLDPGTPAPADPIIAPPGYGRLHAGVGRVSDVDDAGESGWVRELNLDPRNRAAAGLGAQVVRDRQEEFMARAWQQVGRLRDANQRLREAELALVVSRSAYAKHLDGLEPDRALLLTAAAHRGLTTTVTGSPGALTAGPVTVRGAVTASRVPNAVQDPAFRRLTRPARPFVRQATGGRTVDAFQHGLIRELDGTVSAAPVLAPPATTVPITAAMTLATAAVAGLTGHADEPKRVFLTLAADDLAARPGLPTARQFADAMTVAATAWRNAHPAAADQGRRLQLLIDAVIAVTADGPGARVALRTAAFAAEFGDDLAGKGFRGVTAVPEVPPAGGKLARMVDVGLAAEVRDDVASLTADLAARLAEQAPPPLPWARWARWRPTCCGPSTRPAASPVGSPISCPGWPTASPSRRASGPAGCSRCSPTRRSRTRWWTPCPRSRPTTCCPA